MRPDAAAVMAGLATILEDAFRVPRRLIRPGARLARDIGLAGDDAWDLIAALEARFGPVEPPCDWARHIDDEGVPGLRRTEDITLAEIARRVARRN